MIVTLSEREVRLCQDLASARWWEKRGSTDRPNYATGKEEGRLEHELLANIRANVSEYAVAKLTGQPWTTPYYTNPEHPRRKDHPDVGKTMEVRTIRTQTAIPVWEKDITKNAAIVGTKVLDDNYFTEVEVFGWIWAKDCKRTEWHNKTLNGWRVPITALTPFTGETNN